MVHYLVILLAAQNRCMRSDGQSFIGIVSFSRTSSCCFLWIYTSSWTGIELLLRSKRAKLSLKKKSTKHLQKRKPPDPKRFWMASKKHKDDPFFGSSNRVAQQWNQQLHLGGVAPPRRLRSRSRPAVRTLRSFGECFWHMFWAWQVEKKWA